MRLWLCTFLLGLYVFNFYRNLAWPVTDLKLLQTIYTLLTKMPNMIISTKSWKNRPIVKNLEKRCEELTIEENICIKENSSVKQYIKCESNPVGFLELFIDYLFTRGLTTFLRRKDQREFLSMFLINCFVTINLHHYFCSRISWDKVSVQQEQFALIYLKNFLWSQKLNEKNRLCQLRLLGNRW